MANEDGEEAEGCAAWFPPTPDIHSRDCVNEDFNGHYDLDYPCDDQENCDDSGRRSGRRSVEESGGGGGNPAH